MKKRNVAKRHMFYCIRSLIKKQNLSIMLPTYFLCTIHLEMKKLLSRNPPTYASKLSETNIIDLVNQNYSLVEPFATGVGNIFKF